MSAMSTVIEYQLIAARRYWRSVLVGSLITPLFYVLALGVGLGAVVNRNTDQLGVPYLVFVAPAFLTAAAVQVGASEGAYPVLAKFKWERSFLGMAATPLRPRQISDGIIAAIALRLFASSLVYFVIMAAFGGAQRWQAIFAVPAATLCGLAVAAPVAAFSASRMNEGQSFNVLFRFIITPMFLFSGTFYPVSSLPEWGQWLAYLTPLWHGTELARAAAIGGQSGWAILGHLAYLVALLVTGVLLARWRFRLRIEVTA